MIPRKIQIKARGDLKRFFEEVELLEKTLYIELVNVHGKAKRGTQYKSFYSRCFSFR